MEHVMAGGVSSLISCILLQPLDVIKTRLQERAFTHHRPLHYIGNVLKLEGFSCLWKGTLPTMIRNVPGSGCYFLLLHQTKHAFDWMSRRNDHAYSILYYSQGHPSQLYHFMAGGFSRLVAGFIFMPMTVIKARQESSLYHCFSLTRSFSSILQQEGLTGLFRGYYATILRDAPYAGLYLIFYEKLKSIYANTLPSSYMVAKNVSSGFIAGTFTSLVTHPFDVVKTRIQLQPQLYRSLRASFIHIFKNEGMPAFFRGIWPRLFRKSLNAAITWGLYEEMIHILR